MVSTDLKNLSCWIKDDSREAMSCPGSSALGFWRIYLLARGPSFFCLCWSSAEAQPSCSGLLSFHGLSEKGSAFLHSFQIKENIISLQSIPCFFLSPSTSVCPINLFSRGKRLGPTLLGSTASPGTRVGTELFRTVNQKIVPKLSIPRKSCFIWWFGPANFSSQTLLNAGSFRRDQFDPLSLICTVGKKGIKGIKM